MGSPNPEPGLLRDIAERPDDDDPRLILADWLEEHAESGDSRAALIRVQYKLRELAHDAPERPALQALEQVLIVREYCRWRTLFASHDVDVLHIVFERGFPKQVTMRAANFIARAATLFRLAPITGVRITHMYEEQNLELFLNCRNLTRLTALDMSENPLGPGSAQGLAAYANLTQLTELNMSRNLIGHRGAQALADSTNFAQLTTLNLSGNYIGVNGARALATSPNLQRLTKLDLHNNGLFGISANTFLSQAELRLALGIRQTIADEVDHP